MHVKKIIVMTMICLPFFVAAQQNKAQEKKQKAAEKKAKIEQLIKQEEEGALVFQKQSTFGLNFNSDGFGFSYEHGKYKTIKKTNLWWLSLGERKDPKQYKQTNTFTGGGGAVVFFGNSYVYGKQNNFYYLRLGFGQQKLLGAKGSKNGVAVSAIYGGGLSLGMLKPYYVQVPDNSAQGTGIKDIKYTDSTASTFLDPTAIIGGSGFGKGLGEIKFVPGATTRVALRFDYGRFRETISALEVGVNAEFYSQAMPILVGVNDQKKFFFNGYIALQFGRRK